MKSIGIVLLGITIIGCASSLDKCYYYTDNNTQEIKDKKCLRQEINKMLSIHGDKLIGGDFKTIVNTNPIKKNVQNKWIGILSSASQKECNTKVKLLEQELNRFQNLKIVSLKLNVKKDGIVYKCSVKVDGFESMSQMKQFIKNHPNSIIQIKKKTSNQINSSVSQESYTQQNIPHYSVKEKRKEIASGIDNLCVSLKTSYDKLSKRKDTDLRVINRARQKYEECKREQQDLLQYK